jgi:hypothetical protein
LPDPRSAGLTQAAHVQRTSGTTSFGSAGTTIRYIRATHSTLIILQRN